MSSPSPHPHPLLFAPCSARRGIRPPSPELSRASRPNPLPLWSLDRKRALAGPLSLSFSSSPSRALSLVAVGDLPSCVPSPLPSRPIFVAALHGRPAQPATRQRPACSPGAATACVSRHSVASSQPWCGHARAPPAQPRVLCSTRRGLSGSCPYLRRLTLARRFFPRDTFTNPHVHENPKSRFLYSRDTPLGFQ